VKADTIQRPARRMPTEAGVWLFILADMMIFAVFFVTILVYRGRDPVTYGASQARVSETLGLTNTLLMLTGSFLVVGAVRITRKADYRTAFRFVAGAIVCGLAFGAIKLVEYVHLVSAGYGLRANPYYMCFFMFTGIHLLHVVMACALLLWMYVALQRSVTAPNRILVEGVAVFWHMVDLLWLILFALLYLVH
jgi:nitric oxide reductase NorE protein